MIRPLVTFRLRRDGVDHGLVTLRDINALHASDMAQMEPEMARRVRVDAGVCGWRLEPNTHCWLPPGRDGDWMAYWSRPGSAMR